MILFQTLHIQLNDPFGEKGDLPGYPDISSDDLMISHPALPCNTKTTSAIRSSKDVFTPHDTLSADAALSDTAFGLLCYHFCPSFRYF